jgi:hypothetical protein
MLNSLPCGRDAVANAPLLFRRIVAAAALRKGAT